MDNMDVTAEPEAGPSTVTYPTAPVYAFDAAPRQVESLSAGDIKSDARANFFRSARWCPDGSSILVTSEDRVLRVVDTPTELDSGASLQYRSYQQPDAIHASVWYPTASLSQPETFCFATSIKDTPVRLIDASDGRIRATYPIIDHRESFIAPYTMAFSPDASRLYCGHENAIEVIDIATPGPGCSDRIKTTSTKRTKGAQKGIISALAFSTDYSGLYAAGSFSGSVSLYQEDHDGSVGQLEGIVGGGVTQVQFHPLSPNHLFAASRRAEVIQIYDLRNPTEQFGSLPRKGDTNQRLSFDLDPWGRYIATGDIDGQASVWDINAALADTATPPLFTKRISTDAVGSVQLHPFKPLLLTASGSRSDATADVEVDPDSDSDSDSDSSDDDSSISGSIRTARPNDDALRIWSFA